MKILVVDDNKTNQEMLSRWLERKGFEVLLASDGEEGVNRALGDVPDLILMDVVMPKVDGYEATRRIRSTATGRKVPIIAMTAHAMPGQREEALAAGCHDHMTKPLPLAALIAKIEFHLAGGTAKACKNAEHGSLLVVDDNEMNRDLLNRRLSRAGHKVIAAVDGPQGLEMIETNDIETVLLDVMLPGMDGYETLRRIRRRHSSLELPVIMATARDEAQEVVKALQTGANDYVTKPFEYEVVLARVENQLMLRRAYRQIQDLDRQLSLHNAELQASLQRGQRNLQAAAQVQQACLPKPLVEHDGVRFAWKYLPCDELGGDGLDILRPDADHVATYVLDVSGHGVPAALLAVTVSRLLSQTGDRMSLISEPAEQGRMRAVAPPAVMEKLNRIHQLDQATRQFFTMIYALYHRPTRTLRFTTAGHPKLLLLGRQATEAREAGTSDIAVGFTRDATYKEETLRLDSGDRLFFYTDGLIEAMNPDEVMFGDQGLKGAVAATKEMALQEAVDHVIGAVLAWQGGGPAADDMTLLAMEVNP